MSDQSSFIISVLALGFTLFSFWWMNWRPGRLRVGDLRQFAAGRTSTGESDAPVSICIGLPLVIVNTGACTVVLESLRLTPVGRDRLGGLSFRNVESPLWTIDVSQVKQDNFFLPASVKANEVLRSNFVFTAEQSRLKIDRRLYHMHLEGKISWSRDWTKLKDIELDFRDFDDQKLFELNAYYKAYPYRSGDGV